MPISNNPFPQYFIATAGQTVFAYNFTALATTDLAVYRTPAATVPNDISNRLTITTQYTVTLALDFNGGTVTLLTPASAGDVITLSLAMPNERASEYNSVSGFTPDMVNRDFNRDVLMIRQNTYASGSRSPHYNVTQSNVTTGRDLLLPRLTPLTAWRMNAAGTAMESFTPASTSGGINIATAGLATGGPITAAGTITVTPSSRAQVLAGTNATTAVTPQVMDAHKGMLQAWVNFSNAPLAFATRDAYGISGNITQVSVGRYLVTFQVPFGNLFYQMGGMCSDQVITDPTNPTQTGIVQMKVDSMTTNSVQVYTLTRNLTLKNFAINSFYFMGTST